MTTVLNNGPLERAVSALSAVLPSGVDVHPTDGSGRVVVGGTEIAVVWAGKGGLSDVRRVLMEHDNCDVVVARQFSAGAREHLKAEGVGWVDETGSAEIVIGPIIVSRTGRPPKSAPRPPRWTPSVVAIGEALLCGVRGTVAETVEATGLSVGSCTNSLGVLTELGLLEAGAARGPGSARSIVDRRAFLDAYATAAVALRPTMSLQIGVTWRDPVTGLIEVGSEWDRVGLAWTATGVAAASVVAPYLGSVTTVEAYVDATTIVGLEAAATSVGLRPIDGGRLTLRPFPSVSIDQLAQTKKGLRVAPWPRIYADLLGVGVRGEEAAEHLWEVIDAR